MIDEIYELSFKVDELQALVENALKTEQEIHLLQNDIDDDNLETAASGSGAPPVHLGDGINDYSVLTNNALFDEVLLDGKRIHKEDRKREMICRCLRGLCLPDQQRSCCSREQVRQHAKRNS